MSHTPIELRQKLVESLSRGLVGPNGPGDSGWLGASEEDRIITANRKLPDGLPLGPWYAENGEEILRSTPTLVYGVGVLYPKTDDAVNAAANAQEYLDLQTLDSEMSSDSTQEDTVVINTDMGLDSSDTPEEKPDETLTRPRSIALSYRVKDFQSLTVEVSGGQYSTISVLDQPRPWWQRESVKQVVDWDGKTDQEVSLNLGTIEVKIGLNSRKQSDGTSINTVWMRNDSSAHDVDSRANLCLFQSQIKVSTREIVQYDLRSEIELDSLDLLYSNSPRWVVGHGVDAAARKIGINWELKTDSLPVSIVQSVTPDIEDDNQKYQIGMKSLGEMSSDSQNEIERLIQNYTKWISEKRENLVELDEVYRKIGSQHLDKCEDFLTRMKIGWSLIKSSEKVRKTFCDMSTAMNNQRIAYTTPQRLVSLNNQEKVEVAGKNPHTEQTLESHWRPFQLAFILASLESVTNPESAQRKLVDVIWMPTGGGKTEAYLGLAGFTILWQRYLDKETSQLNNRSYTKVLMRYTLRLLTAQQLSRAASLICALEVLRRTSSGRYGSNEIRIGAWLGSKSSPNKWEEAIAKHNSLVSGDKSTTSFMLQQCPWCGAQIGNILGKQITGYKRVQVPGKNVYRVQAHCPDLNCDFAFKVEAGKPRGIPVFEIDEDIYTSPPDFIVGTIDKFARLAWEPAFTEHFWPTKWPKKISFAQFIDSR